MVRKYRIGGLLSGQALIIDGEDLKYKGLSKFSVPISQITTVTIDTVKGFGITGRKARLKIVGSGTELASVELPEKWAQKAYEWLQQNLDFSEKGLGKSPLEELEKLSELKNKGVVTEEEFEKKKRDLLNL